MLVKLQHLLVGRFAAERPAEKRCSCGGRCRKPRSFAHQYRTGMRVLLHAYWWY